MNKLAVFALCCLLAAVVVALPAGDSRRSTGTTVEVIRLEVIEVPPSASLQAFDFAVAAKGRSASDATATEDKAGTETKGETKEEKKDEDKGTKEEMTSKDSETKTEDTEDKM